MEDPSRMTIRVIRDVTVRIKVPEPVYQLFRDDLRYNEYDWKYVLLEALKERLEGLRSKRARRFVGNVQSLIDTVEAEMVTLREKFEVSPR